jgi:hypothetical protein
MSKVSMLARNGRALMTAMLLVSIALLTASCGGGGSAATPPPVSNNPPAPPPPPAAIEGVATPTSVSVVTATNAQ